MTAAEQAGHEGKAQRKSGNKLMVGMIHEKKPAKKAG
jgi:hypothetical protein